MGKVRYWSPTFSPIFAISYSLAHDDLQNGNRSRSRDRNSKKDKKPSRSSDEDHKKKYHDSRRVTHLIFIIQRSPSTKKSQTKLIIKDLGPEVQETHIREEIEKYPALLVLLLLFRWTKVVDYNQISRNGLLKAMVQISASGKEADKIKDQIAKDKQWDIHVSSQNVDSKRRNSRSRDRHQRDHRDRNKKRSRSHSRDRDRKRRRRSTSSSERRRKHSTRKDDRHHSHSHSKSKSKQINATSDSNKSSAVVPSQLKSRSEVRVRELWVGNLPDKVNENMIYSHFFIYGEIDQIEFYPNESRPQYAFVRYKLTSCTSRACDQSNGLEMAG